LEAAAAFSFNIKHINKHPAAGTFFSLFSLKKPQVISQADR
jgi:hypothetical protein